MRVHVHHTRQQPHARGVDHLRTLRRMILRGRHLDNAVTVNQHGGVRTLRARPNVDDGATCDGEQLAHAPTPTVCALMPASGSTSSTNRRYWSFWFQLVIRKVTSVNPRSRICWSRSTHCFGEPVATHWSTNGRGNFVGT